jgi:phosphoribosyl 1,2-cyclic phosphate phosphodiesterase
MNFTEALAVQALIKPRRTFFTHIQCEISHALDEPLLPNGVKIAYDGLELTWD